MGSIHLKHGLRAAFAAGVVWTLGSAIGCGSTPAATSDNGNGSGTGTGTDTTTTTETGGKGGSGTTTTTTTGKGGAGGQPEACPGSKLCNGKCVDVSLDPKNCGDCGATCKDGEVCSAGKCGLGCGAGTVQCGDKCTDTKVDPANCGACGKACGEGQVCSAGICAVECFGGTTKCPGQNGDTCVDTQSDHENCGACGTACGADEVCTGGKCGSQCVGGTTSCGGKCVDTNLDPANCGGCGKACQPGEVCSAGKCGILCGGGTTQCGQACVNVAVDPANCGQCGNVCQNGQVCSAGQCALDCGGGTKACNGKCVDPNVDPANCGACGVACAAGQVCSQGACSGVCGGNLTKCGNVCTDTTADSANCGACGNACAAGSTCQAGKCVACDSNTTDCDGDGWKVADGDCCDKPGACGAQPALVNPGAIEVVGNGIDDNCNGLADLFDTADTLPCDTGLTSNSQNAVDYAKAIGVCRQTVEAPAALKDKSWGLIAANILHADGSAVTDFRGISIRSTFGSVSPAVLNGQAAMVISSGTAADATETNPGPNGGAPAGANVSNSQSPASGVDISVAKQYSVQDWYATANAPLKPANGLPDAPGCNTQDSKTANDSVMLRLRMRAPTNAKAFSFNSYFISAEYPEFVCTSYNDQLVALVDTPNGVPSPIKNPVDKNLMTFSQGGQLWPIGINIAHGTSLFAVCDSKASNPGCWDADVSALSCSKGSAQLKGTGFEAPNGQTCTIGGGTYWLTTAGNVIPGDIVELRIAVWDVGDSIYDSLALVDGFQWLANATLPGTGGQ
jgi:hypothetical protein